MGRGDSSRRRTLSNTDNQGDLPAQTRLQISFEHLPSNRQARIKRVTEIGRKMGWWKEDGLYTRSASMWDEVERNLSSDMAKHLEGSFLIEDAPGQVSDVTLLRRMQVADESWRDLHKQLRAYNAGSRNDTASSLHTQSGGDMPLLPLRFSTGPGMAGGGFLLEGSGLQIVLKKALFDLLPNDRSVKAVLAHELSHTFADDGVGAYIRIVRDLLLAQNTKEGAWLSRVTNTSKRLGFVVELLQEEQWSCEYVADADSLRLVECADVLEALQAYRDYFAKRPPLVGRTKWHRTDHPPAQLRIEALLKLEGLVS